MVKSLLENNPMRKHADNFRFADDYIGKKREEMFVHAWKHCPNPPIWYKGVRRAGWAEDHRDKIDAFLFLQNGSKIPIQIKGTAEALVDYVAHNNGLHRVLNLWVVIVLVKEHDLPTEIIESTLFAIEMVRQKLGVDYLHDLRPAIEPVSGKSFLELQLEEAVREMDGPSKSD